MKAVKDNYIILAVVLDELQIKSQCFVICIFGSFFGILICIK